MELMELKEIYRQYVLDYAQVRRKATPMDGLFGMGQDPRKDPCHMRFYEAVEQWVAAFAAERPEGEQAYLVVHWILAAPAEHTGKAVYWFMFAAHGLCRELIPLLSPAQCAELRMLYDENYPRRDRMPLQKEVYKLLRKGAEKK